MAEATRTPHGEIAGPDNLDIHGGHARFEWDETMHSPLQTVAGQLDEAPAHRGGESEASLS